MQVISCRDVDYIFFIRYSKFTAVFPACSFASLFFSVHEKANDPNFHLFQSLKRNGQAYV